PALSLREREKTHTDLYIVLDRLPHLREREKTRTDLYIVLDRFPHLRKRRKPAPTFTPCSIGSLSLRERARVRVTFNLANTPSPPRSARRAA
ncbi:hypothetical protein, partial [Pseudocitrobacter faecalis]|uniref:hypothetical protein n=1 Tax=Pseudocitrobacter faecalis TaxID=1398493 RepID=UPI003B9FDE54